MLHSYDGFSTKGYTILTSQHSAKAVKKNATMQKKHDVNT